MSISNIEMQDENGNIYYPKTIANDVFFEDGTTIQQKLEGGSLKGDKGEKGERGEQGIQGLPGAKGEDGVSSSSNLIDGKAEGSILGKSGRDEDDHPLGRNAMAIGSNTRASGSDSLATGYRTYAMGNESFTSGFDNVAMSSVVHYKIYMVDGNLLYCDTRRGNGNFEANMVESGKIPPEIVGREVIITYHISQNAWKWYQFKTKIKSILPNNVIEVESMPIGEYNDYKDISCGTYVNFGANDNSPLSYSTHRGASSSGVKSIATGGASSAEGHMCEAHGYASHAEGFRTIAEGAYSHTEGVGTIAHSIAHVEGWGSMSYREALYKVINVTHTDTETILTTDCVALKDNSLSAFKVGLYLELLTQNDEGGYISNEWTRKFYKILGSSVNSITIELLPDLDTYLNPYFRLPMISYISKSADHVEGEICISSGETNHVGGHSNYTIGTMNDINGFQNIVYGSCNVTHGSENSVVGGDNSVSGIHNILIGGNSSVNGIQSISSSGYPAYKFTFDEDNNVLKVDAIPGFSDHNLIKPETPCLIILLGISNNHWIPYSPIHANIKTVGEITKRPRYPYFDNLPPTIITLDRKISTLLTHGFLILDYRDKKIGNNEAMYTSHSCGHEAITTGKGSFANGAVSYAINDYSFAHGNYSVASGRSSVTMGSYVNAYGDYSVSIGHEVDSYNHNSFSAGKEINSYGANSATFGVYNEVGGKDSLTAGSHCWSYNHGAIMVGESLVSLSDDVYLINKSNNNTRVVGYSQAYISSPLQIGDRITIKDIGTGHYDRTITDIDTNAKLITLDDMVNLSGSGILMRSTEKKYILNRAIATNETGTGGCGLTFGASNYNVGNYSFVNGTYNISFGDYSFVNGIRNRAIYDKNFVFGEFLETYDAEQTIFGRNNIIKPYVENSTVEDDRGSSDAFIIGNGVDKSHRSNAFRITATGATYGMSAFNSTGADYAEFFEWVDGNPNNEDRVGHFVTFSDDKIKIANQNDDYILGVISGNPSVIGNSHNDMWNEMYVRDEFDRIVYEDVEVPDTFKTIHHDAVYENPQNTNPLDIGTNKKANILISEAYDEEVLDKPKHMEHRMKINPLYDQNKEYIPREKRPEWSAVGMFGVLSVYDDGTCTVNGYAKVSNNGIATKSDSGYRVLKRVTGNIIKILFRS